jgi:hypothetical protein
MMTLEKSFDEISYADIQELTIAEIPEGKTVEYKEFLPDDSYDSKKEFLADISSFANTSGGHILFGIKEEKGIPADIPGLVNIDFDQEILRLENIIRDGIEPRISDISVKKISSDTVKSILIIRVPQSWSKPHAVNYKGHWRFYSRNSAGKYPLDVLELKSAFIASTALEEKIRKFHLDRLNKIVSEETPVHLFGKARTIIHFIPFVSFEPGFTININSLESDAWSFNPIHSSTTGYRYNLDGMMTYSEMSDDLFRAYLQIFRNGIVESVDAFMLRSRGDESFIPTSLFEEKVIQSVEICLSIQQQLSITLPSTLIVSLIGVKGYKLGINQKLDPWHEHTNKIDRDLLILPEIVVSDYSVKPETLLRPIFDAIWNSAGWPRSYGYDDAGKWGKGPNFR